MRAWDNPEFTILTSGARDRNTDSESATVAAVSTHGTVLVPAHVGDPFHHANFFQQTLGRISDVWVALDKPIIGKGADRSETIAVEKFPQRRRLLVEPEDPRGIPLPGIGLRPPRSSVITFGRINSRIEFGRDRSHLGTVEHAPKVEKPSLREKVADLFGIVFKRERPPEVERSTLEVLESDGPWFVHWTSIEQTSKDGLPFDKCVESALSNFHPAGHLETERRGHILHEVGERARIERHDERISTVSGHNQASIFDLNGQEIAINIECQRRERKVFSSTTSRGPVRGNETRQPVLDEINQFEMNLVALELRSEINGCHQPSPFWWKSGMTGLPPNFSASLTDVISSQHVGVVSNDLDVAGGHDVCCRATDQKVKAACVDLPARRPSFLWRWASEHD